MSVDSVFEEFSLRVDSLLKSAQDTASSICSIIPSETKQTKKSGKALNDKLVKKERKPRAKKAEKPKSETEKEKKPRKPRTPKAKAEAPKESETPVGPPMTYTPAEIEAAIKRHCGIVDPSDKTFLTSLEKKLNGVDTKLLKETFNRLRDSNSI